MPKPCSLELRERVVDAVESGASRREAADWFEVSPSSAIKWMQRRQATGSALEQLDERAKAYIRDFGLRVNFRAALLCVPVAIGELGTIKMVITLLGDTKNTAAATPA